MRSRYFDYEPGFAEFEFYCRYEWIGQGVGTALMNAIHAIARNQKINEIFGLVYSPVESSVSVMIR